MITSTNDCARGDQEFYGAASAFSYRFVYFPRPIGSSVVDVKPGHPRVAYHTPRSRLQGHTPSPLIIHHRVTIKPSPRLQRLPRPRGRPRDASKSSTVCAIDWLRR